VIALDLGDFDGVRLVHERLRDGFDELFQRYAPPPLRRAPPHVERLGGNATLKPSSRQPGPWTAPGQSSRSQAAA
jgi:hypothetical protein